MSWQEFRQRFQFTQHLAWNIGIERERFVTDAAGVIMPASNQFLVRLPNDGRFGPELSACQLEDRVGPCLISEVSPRLRENNEAIAVRGWYAHLTTAFIEVAPETMPLDVYPDSAGRYASIATMLGPERLLAACRVAGTHVHVGMPDADTALRVYNGVASHWQELVTMGDHSHGERLRLYRVVVPNSTPQSYASWESFAAVARANGYFENPRNCWDLIRLSVHGTIEFRMFGATDDSCEVEHWAATCLELCQSVR